MFYVRVFKGKKLSLRDKCSFSIKNRLVYILCAVCQIKSILCTRLKHSQAEHSVTIFVSMIMHTNREVAVIAIQAVNDLLAVWYLMSQITNKSAIDLFDVGDFSQSVSRLAPSLDCHCIDNSFFS